MSETIPTTPSAVDQPVKARHPLRLSMVLMWVGIIALLAMLGWGLLNTTAARPEVGQPAPDFDVQKYADQGVVVLGVAYADVEPNSLAYMDDFGVTFPHAPDLGTDISQTYEITGVPETFIIDKDGVIRHVQIGAVNEAMLDQIIPELLAQ
jgi:cytochrome c biogenesis protein CcmG/thiol:disulfide interchange protein DsbE